MAVRGIVNLFALMPYQGRGRDARASSLPQAALAETVTFCQIWNHFLSS